MNVEGGTWDENFISTKKLVVIGLIMFSLMFIILHIVDAGVPFITSVVYIALWFIISLYALRFIVFEERFYYKMYKILKNYEVTTPAIFWDIASINNTPDGAILTFSDTKIGVLVRLERDTITGKHPDFKEVHYDAVSDFYKALNNYKYKFVQMNIMEKAGNDPRLENLDPLVHKSDNNNICKLMEKEIGYIKNITHNTLYESDYILVYTHDLTKVDTIVSDIIDCVYKILDGAYVDYRILSSKEIIEFVKEIYGVKYFNYTQATLDMYKLSGATTGKPFTMCSLQYTDGKYQDLNSSDINKIYSMTSEVLSGARKIDEISIRETLNKNKRKESNEVDFDNIGMGFKPEPVQPKNSRGSIKNKFGQRNSRQNQQNLGRLDDEDYFAEHFSGLNSDDIGFDSDEEDSELDF